MLRIFRFLVFGCVGNLPLGLRRFLGSFGGLAASLIPTREKKIAMLHLSALGLPGSPSRTVREMFQNLGRSLMESLNPIPILRSGRIVIEPRDRERIDQLLSGGRGVLALTAHCGNWDLLGAYFAEGGRVIHTIGRVARHPLVQSLLEELRGRSGIKTIWRNDGDGLRSIISVLKGGGVLAALIDQDTQVTSRFSPFFGVPAKTPSTLVEIAVKHNCSICVAFLAREDGGRFRIIFHEVPEGLAADEVLRCYHEKLEAHIKRYPSQWVWFHKRWRTAPGANTLGTAAYIDALEHGSIALRNR